MLLKVGSVILALLVVVPALPAHAASEVKFDTEQPGICGPREVALRGSAEVESAQYLILQLDEMDIEYAFEDGQWSTDTLWVESGEHTVTATVYEADQTLGSARLEFDIKACEGEETEEDSSDVSIELVKPVGQVKAAMTNDLDGPVIMNQVVPVVVERLFGQVYGREITPHESTYWKKRARNDKRTETSLKGAMQWHRLRGRSIGR